MKIKETKSVTKNQEVTTSIKCDVCGKVHNGDYTPEEWHEISIHHHHWGNDSVESYEYFDVCSPECYWQKIKECVAEYEGFTDAKIDDFEIQFARRLVNSL